MSQPPNLPPVALEHARERTIRELCDHFAADHISDTELERRLDVATRATALAELGTLTGDLPALAAGTPALASRPGVAMARPQDVRESQTFICVMSGNVRKGHWTPARDTNVLAVMGGCELDFRDAAMPAGLTQVNIFAMMGGVQITVPPGVRVEMNGFAFMGGFDHSIMAPPPADPDAPVLRVNGFAFMGGVDVHTLNPGERPGDARHRLRAERHQIRAELKREMRRIRRG
jgi:hypothetical protein